MASYYLSVVKRVGEQTWSNRYTLFTENIAAAKTAAMQVVNIERAVHDPMVAFIGYRLQNTILNSPDNATEGLNLAGTHVTTANTYLPLWNVIRVLFHTGTGKPSIKYLRPPVLEDWQANGVLVGSIPPFFVTNYCQPLLGLAAFKDVDGQAFVSSNVHSLVRMRQLDRRRKTRPGFHRGWVANS